MSIQREKWYNTPIAIKCVFWQITQYTFNKKIDVRAIISSLEQKELNPK